MSRVEAARLGRIAVWLVLVALWLFALWNLWHALQTLPGDPAGAGSLAAAPTARTVAAVAAFSGLELAVVLALLWPRRPELYATRLAIGVLALTTWLVTTAGARLTELDHIHRRWLEATTLTLVVALAVVLLSRLAHRHLTPRDPAITL